MSSQSASEPLPQPKEVIELGWSNTSEEKIKEAYIGWAADYDSVGRVVENRKLENRKTLPTFVCSSLLDLFCGVT